MGGASDASQRSSSPLKRLASELDEETSASQLEDVDMIPVPASDPDSQSASKPSPLAARAQSVDMLDSLPEQSADEAEPQFASPRKSEEIPPIDYQVKTITTLIKELNEAIPREGDKVYLISERWLRTVTSRASESTSKEPEGELGPVDNSDIIQQILKDSQGGDFVQLKRGLGFESFQMFPESAWELVISWYGLMPGTLPIIRYAHNTAPDKQSLPNIVFEFHPPVFTIHRLWSEVSPIALPQVLKARNPPAPVFVASRSMRYVDFLKSIKKLVEIDVTRKVRIWRVPRKQPAANVAASTASTVTPPSSRPGSPNVAPASGEQQSPQDTWKSILLDISSFTQLEKGVEREVVDLPDESNNNKYNGSIDLSLAGLGEDQTIVIDEHVSGNDYVSNNTKRENKTSSAITKTSTTGITNQANSQANSGRNSPAPSGPLTRGRTQRSGRTIGCVGLSNLGNTCYMNSALQCLRSVEELTKYFLTETSDLELNTDNPLGNNGQVAVAYGMLLKEMFRDPAPASITPRNFKQIIGRYAPQFSGYGQQDSQEFLGFLLDGLQEDLSRVKKKPYIEKPDSTDEMVNDDELIREMAAKVWDITKKRDDSVIADLFTGMYKSTLVCPECTKVSITFDPFNNLTLQLPIENAWSHDILYYPLNDAPVKVRVDMDKHGSIKALKQFVSQRVAVPIERLFCAEEYKGKFYKVHDDMKSVSEEIQSGDICVIYELEAEPTNWPPPKKANKGRKKTSYNDFDSDDADVPNWDSPMADRMVVPVIHRRALDQSEKTRGVRKGNALALAIHTIIITPQEARSEDAIRRKVLEKVQTFTTKNIDSPDSDSSESIVDIVDSDIVITNGSDVSSGSSKVASRSVDGEEEMVDITMKDQASHGRTQPSSITSSPRRVFNGTRPKFLDPGSFLTPELQNAFDMSYYSGTKELIPLGWNSIDEDKVYPSLSSRSPASPMDDSASNDRASTSSDDSTLISSTTSNTRMTEESSDEDELSRPNNVALPARPKTPKKIGAQVGLLNRRRPYKIKTYSKKNKPARRISVQDDVDTETFEDGPLVRLGEGLIVDWKYDAWSFFFNADSEEDSMRGRSTVDADRIPYLPDEELLKKRSTRAARKRNGITLEDCLNEFGKEEILSEQDTWYCPRCKEHRRASKKFELWKTPDILVMHLKRFSSSASRRDKLDVLVDFPIEGLDLSSRVIEKFDGKKEIYDLIAVDDHWGGLGGGHYTAFAKNFNDNQWYEYNDSSVSKTSDPCKVVSSSAYLLFYRRRSDIPLGGPRFKAIVEHGTAAAESSDDEDTADSGEDQVLAGNSSQRGSSRALTGAGAVLPQQNGSSGNETKTINPQDLELPDYESHLDNDDGAPLLIPDADLNSGLGLRSSIEDEGVDMSDYDYGNKPQFSTTGNNWSFANLDRLTQNNRGAMPSGTTSDMEVNSNFSRDDRSDIMQDNSSAGSVERNIRMTEFQDTAATSDSGLAWEDPSPIPDMAEDGRIDMGDLHGILSTNQRSRSQPAFNVTVDHAQLDQDVEEPATEIHVEDGEGLK
ncbi:ubiquitin carboxyl-terminal hydrolase [Phlyctema vagabunda]|uniref:ubiquitinyl hydrolase 1 n=1 Tax=Phlyctema vagabunda TaxID=108571 RepID=A0ABR4P217_9HELO